MVIENLERGGWGSQIFLLISSFKRYLRFYRPNSFRDTAIFIIKDKYYTVLDIGSLGVCTVHHFTTSGRERFSPRRRRGKKEKKKSLHGAILFYICTEIRTRETIINCTYWNTRIFIPPPLLFIVVFRFFSPVIFVSFVVGKRGSVYFFQSCSFVDFCSEKSIFV